MWWMFERRRNRASLTLVDSPLPGIESGRLRGESDVAAPKNRWPRRWRALPGWGEGRRRRRNRSRECYLSEATLVQAQNQKNAGTARHRDHARESAARQRPAALVVAENARRAAHLQLLRAMGVRLDTEIELTDKLQYVPVDSIISMRPSPKRSSSGPTIRPNNCANPTPGSPRIREDGASAFARRTGRLRRHRPGLNNARPTRTYGISLRCPSSTAAGAMPPRGAESQYRAQKVQTNDLKEQIDLDVRLALDRLRSAEDEVSVARDGSALAESELTQPAAAMMQESPTAWK